MPDEIIFTKNATEALNLVAQSWGRANLGPGDAVLLTHMEHHSNIVPWQILAAERGFEIRWLPLTPDGHLDLADLDRLLDGSQPARRHRDVQRAGHPHPCQGPGRGRPRRRGARAGGRLPVRSPRPEPT